MMWAVMPHPPRRPEHLRALTGLRIVAAAWVVLTHLSGRWWAIWPELPDSAITNSGYFAVDLFFVLSGLVLAHNHFEEFASGRGDYLHFLRKRLARIYPLHLVTLVAMVLLFMLGAHVADPTLRGAIGDLTLVRSWFGNDMGWNLPAWSLSAEWLAYLLFPAVVVVVARSERARGWLLTGLIAALVLVDGYGSWAYPGVDGQAVAPIRVLTAFTVGVALARLAPYLRRVRGAGLIASAALIALIGALPLLDDHWWVTSAALFFCTLAVAGFGYGTGGFAALLASRPFVYAGKVSFALYLVHVPFGSLMDLLLPTAVAGGWSQPIRIGLVAVEVVLLGLLACAAHHFIEAPAARRFGRRSERASVEHDHAGQLGHDRPGLLGRDQRALEHPEPVEVAGSERGAA